MLLGTLGLPALQTCKGTTKEQQQQIHESGCVPSLLHVGSPLVFVPLQQPEQPSFHMHLLSHSAQRWSPVFCILTLISRQRKARNNALLLLVIGYQYP